MSTLTLPAPSNSLRFKGLDRRIGNMNLEELARSFQQGDPAGFEGIVESMRDRVYALALRSLRDPGEAEDLAQDVFIKVHRGIGTLKDPAACERWIYQIALNLIRDRGRRRSLERRAVQAASLEIREFEEPHPPAEDSGSLETAILEAVDELPEHHREVFVMREIQGLAHPEIARSLGIPEGTVWSRLSFARRTLQEKLRRRLSA